MKISLPSNAVNFLNSLIPICPDGTEIWIMGSRANGRERPDSDTDFLVFSTINILDLVKTKLDKPQKIDCLIIYDGNNYRDPWQKKSGSLSGLKWQPIDDRSARYIGTKWIPDNQASSLLNADFGDLIELDERAYKIWPEPNEKRPLKTNLRRSTKDGLK